MIVLFLFIKVLKKSVLYCMKGKLSGLMISVLGLVGLMCFVFG